MSDTKAAPMPETMSPREKVKLKPCPFCGDDPFDRGFRRWECPCGAQGPAGSKSEATDGWNRRAALAASGDHAELIEDAIEALQIIDAFPSNQGEVEGRITEKGDRLLMSCTRDARLALDALIAENEALRSSLTKANDGFEEYERKFYLEQDAREEAERKLAEEEGIASKLSTAISWLDYPFIDNNTSEDELRLRVGFMMKDAEHPRAMLSKEAERG